MCVCVCGGGGGGGGRKEREEERPWEGGWPLGFLNDSSWGHVTTEKIKTILIVK